MSIFVIGIFGRKVNAYDAQECQGITCVPVHMEIIKTCELIDRALKKENLIVKRNLALQKRITHKDAGRFNRTISHIKRPLTHLMEVASSQVKRAPTVPVQKIGLNFTAATIANVQDPLVIPPNLNGWVGAQQYILMTYNIIRSFNKYTGKPDGILDLDSCSFFGVSSNDVRIDYDRFSQRWFMSCESIDESTGQIANLVLAVSLGSVIDAHTTWIFYTFSNAQLIPQIRPVGSGDLDYQQLAIDKNAVYISADAFDKSGNFCGSSVLVISKNSIGRSNPVATVFSGVFSDSLSEFTPPADNFDSNPAFGYVINAYNSGYPSGNLYNELTLCRISNPGSASPSLGSAVTISVPDYTDPANAPYQGNLFGDLAFLQTSFGMLTAPHVRNRQLFVCHNIQVDRYGMGNPDGDRVGVRWYQLDLTGDSTGRARGTETVTTVPALVQSGTLYDATSITNPLFYFNPSMMTNKKGDMVIACTVSGETAYANVVYAGRVASDPLGTLRTPVLITNSSYPYNFGPYVDASNANIGQRWGDESSVCPDPTNDLDMWTTQEFAALNNGWGIQVTQLIPT